LDVLAQPSRGCSNQQSRTQFAFNLLTRSGRIGHANCIEVDPASGMLRAVADSGRDGGDADAY